MTGLPLRYQPPCPCKCFEPDYACIDSRNCIRPAQWDIWVSLPDDSARSRITPEQIPIAHTTECTANDINQRDILSQYDCAWPSGCSKTAKLRLQELGIFLCKCHYQTVRNRINRLWPMEDWLRPTRLEAGRKCDWPHGCDNKGYRSIRKTKMKFCQGHYFTYRERWDAGIRGDDLFLPEGAIY